MTDENEKLANSPVTDEVEEAKKELKKNLEKENAISVFRFIEQEFAIYSQIYPIKGYETREEMIKKVVPDFFRYVNSLLSKNVIL